MSSNKWPPCIINKQPKPKPKKIDLKLLHASTFILLKHFNISGRGRPSPINAHSSNLLSLSFFLLSYFQFRTFTFIHSLSTFTFILSLFILSLSGRGRPPPINAHSSNLQRTKVTFKKINNSKNTNLNMKQ